MRENEIKRKRVVVTGGAGVIGRELLRILVEEGADVLSVDRERLPDHDWGNVKHLRIDLADRDLIDIRKFEPEIIFHLAAAFERSKESPDFWEPGWHDNMIVSHRLSDVAAQAKKLEVFVFASSYLVYDPSLYLFPTPSNEAVTLKETDKKSPRNLCGAAKYYVEKELDFVQQYLNPAVRMVSARIFRVYGYGSRDIVSRWVRAALVEEELEIYNARNRFDYIFAGDVADGLVRLAKSSRANGPVSLGRGESRSVQELLDHVVMHVPGFRSPVKNKGDNDLFEASCADLTKLKEVTGWTPPTDLESGVKLIVEFEAGKRHGVQAHG
jgi:nucleoside-diphosphate-sugar epimerase